MFGRGVLKVVVAGCVVGALLVLASVACAATSVTLCVPAGEGAAITTPSKGSCGAGTSVTLPGEKAEQEKLISILPHVDYEASGIDKQPTIQFTGVNLQVIDGSGSETTVNGTGNLILGYDEKPGTQTGSHDLLLGGTGNSYTSYGGIVGGAYNNKISSGYASVLGGGENTASGYASTILGGRSNKASVNLATVGGGCSTLPARARSPSTAPAPKPRTPATSPRSSAASATRPARWPRPSAAVSSTSPRGRFRVWPAGVMT